jgi:hypothetical protein
MDSDDDELPPQLQASAPLVVPIDSAIQPVPVTILTGEALSSRSWLV